MPSVEEFVQELPSGSEVISKRTGRHVVASLSSMITSVCGCATLRLLENDFPVWVLFPFPLLGAGGCLSLWVALPQPLPDPSVLQAAVW